MAQINSINLKEYLRIVSELECSVYRQEQVIKKAKEDLHLTQPIKKNINEPINKSQTFKLPDKPVFNNVSKASTGGDSGQWSSGQWFLMGGVFGILSFICIALGDEGLIYGGICLLLSIMCFWMYKGLKKDEDREYSRAMSDYERLLASAKQNKKKLDDQYKTDLEKYEKEKKLIEERYRKECEIAEKNYTAAKRAVNSLDKPLKNSKEKLQELYNLNIIFPKYRNMVAMTTMYEYFASGRCDQLDGAFGAYNLYESELRQNIIINKLDVIIKRLDAIIDNQYILYKEMKKTNEQLWLIDEKVSEIVKNTQSIANSSELTALVSTITAENTSVIASATQYIALMK